MAYPIHQMTTQAQTPYAAFLAAKKNLKAVQACFAQADQALSTDRTAPGVMAKWCVACDALTKAEEEYHAAYDAAYPMPDIETTSAHVIVRKLGLANLMESQRIVEEQHAAGNLKFSRVFRGEAKRISDIENFEITI